MSKKWVVLAKGADFNQIAADFGISPYLARIIRNRGPVTNEQIDQFLNPDVKKMHDPALLKDIDVAAGILEDAIEAQVPMRIVGDYDIDGVCASYILKKGIEALGGVADVRLPERIRDGYGINADIIKQANEDGIELIITCDNGIAAAEEVELALSLGMSVIVTDHHEVPFDEKDGRKQYRIPCADAVIDPKRPDCTYPFDGICGAMVAYKLITYMFDRTDIGGTVRDMDRIRDELLSFAAFATVGDLMELTDENRIAVSCGLKILRKTTNPGIRALTEATGTDPERISAYHIGFVLGPCVNATGRLGTADAALELFDSTDENDAREKAHALVEINRERKKLTDESTETAIRMVEEEYGSDRVLVVYLPECHESIAGIVAGRLREHFYRPSIVLTDDSEGNIKGSGRSIEAYNMFDELNRVRDLFTRFGGHKMAAGLSMPAGSADILRTRLNEQCTLNDDDLVEKMKIDIPLPIGYIDDAFVEELARLEPFGIKNPRPLFAQKDVRVRRIDLQGSERKVVKLKLEGADPSGSTKIFDAICFDDAENLYERVKDRQELSILYQPSFNEFQGRRTIQLVLKDCM